MADSDTPAELSQEYGINGRSSMLSLAKFDLCSGGLLPDVMHDVLEGALQYELKLLLQYLIDHSHFHVSTLNTMKKLKQWNWVTWKLVVQSQLHHIISALQTIH